MRYHLPYELQSRCLREAIDDASLDAGETIWQSPMPQNRTTTFMALRSVCQLWNHILLSESSYWSTIGICEDTCWEWIETMIERAKAKPLTLAFGINRPENPKPIPWMEEISSHLAPYLQKCEEINLSLLMKGLKIVLDRWNVFATPMLRTLKLGLKADSSTNTNITFLDLSSIHMLSAKPIPLTSLSLFCRATIPHINAARMPHLKELTVTLSRIPNGRDGLDQILSTLGELERLHVLHSKSVFFHNLLGRANLKSVHFTAGSLIMQAPSKQSFDSNITSMFLNCSFLFEGDFDAFVDCVDALHALEDLQIIPTGWSASLGLTFSDLRRSGLQKLRCLDVRVEEGDRWVPFTLLTKFEFPSLDVLQLHKSVSKSQLGSDGPLTMGFIVGFIVPYLRNMTFPALRHLKLDFLEETIISTFLQSSPALEYICGKDTVNPPSEFLNLLIPTLHDDVSWTIHSPHLRGIDFEFEAPNVEPTSHSASDSDEDEDTFEDMRNRYNDVLVLMIDFRNSLAEFGLCPTLHVDSGPILSKR